jgi:hypothetical protein
MEKVYLMIFDNYSECGAEKRHLAVLGSFRKCNVTK